MARRHRLADPGGGGFRELKAPRESTLRMSALADSPGLGITAPGRPSAPAFGSASARACGGKSVLVLQHSDSFDCDKPKTPKNAAFAGRFALPVIPTLMLTFRHKRPGAKSGDFRASRWTGVAASFGRHDLGKGVKYEKSRDVGRCRGHDVWQRCDRRRYARQGAPGACRRGEPVGLGVRRRADVGLQFPRHLAIQPRSLRHRLFGAPLQRQFELPALPRQPVLGGDAADQSDRRGRHLRRRPLHAGPVRPRHRRHVLLVSARAAVRRRRRAPFPPFSERQRDARRTPTSGKSTASSPGKS